MIRELSASPVVGVQLVQPTHLRLNPHGDSDWVLSAFIHGVVSLLPYPLGCSPRILAEWSHFYLTVDS